MTIFANIFVFLLMLLCVSVAGASAVHVARDADQADPLSGLHWRWSADPQHPAAPPRLTLVRGSGWPLEKAKQPSRPVICVRAGDHVLLREAGVNLSMMSLEATALESGACGARVRARVAVTGALVDMTVLDAGSGILTGKAVAWR
jgi:hypothetical protein